MPLRIRAALILIGSFGVASCSGGTGRSVAPVRLPTATPVATASPTPQSTATPLPAAQTVTFKIDGGAVAASASKRRPQYVSPSTQSLALSISASSGATVDTSAVGITPSSPNCSTVAGVIGCNVTVSLLPGSYTGSITAFDGPVVSGNPSGNVLSKNSAFPFQVANGTAGSVGLTLTAVPASIAIAPAPNETHVIGDATNGYSLIGTADVAFDVVSKDADGNIIIGPGAPQYSVTSNGTQVVVDEQPGSAAPATAELRGPAFFPAAATVTASVRDAAQYPSCSCSASIPVAAGTVEDNDQFVLTNILLAEPYYYETPYGYTYESTAGFTANQTAIELYTPSTIVAVAPPYTSTGVSSPIGIPACDLYAIAIDDGTLYCALVSSGTLTLNASIPPYTSMTSIFSVAVGSYGPTQLAAGSNGAVALAWSTASNVGAALRPSESLPFTQTTLATGEKVSFGADGAMVAMTAPVAGTGSQVLVFSGSATPATYPVDAGTTFNAATTDAASNLYIATSYSGMQIVAPPYTGMPHGTSLQVLGLYPAGNGVLIETGYVGGCVGFGKPRVPHDARTRDYTPDCLPNSELDWVPPSGTPIKISEGAADEPMIAVP